MREFVLAFLCGALIAISVRAEGPSDRYSIRKHRYSPHGDAGYERFVIEFDGARRSDAAVEVSGGNGEWVIRVANARLDGAIPESAMNDRTLVGAHVFKSVAIDADGSGRGFSLRFTTKRRDAQLKAFWLESPSRLVIDAYASGIPVAGARGVAGRGKQKGPEYFCFSAEAQVGLSTVFQRKLRGEPAPDVAPPTATSNEPIVCYPAAAQVVARVLLERQRGPSAAAPMPVEAEPAVAEAPAIEPALDPVPVRAVNEDTRRYWIAPYLPAANGPAVSPMEPPKAASAPPVTEGLKEENAVAGNDAGNPARRTSSLPPARPKSDDGDDSLGPLK
jgi:hypothetical protein